jgi:mannose-1-phosphate guanylyltransferase
MKGLLLAAGLGTRLRPMTNNTPKCLVEINGRPLLDYWLEMLINNGLEKILVNTHHFPEQVESYIKNSKWKKVVSTVHEENLLGTAGSIIEYASFFKNEKNSFIAHADNLTMFKFQDFFSVHQNRPENTEITMMTFHTDDPNNCGIVGLDNNMVVQSYYEKQKNTPGFIANGAIFLLSEQALAEVVALKELVFDFSADVIPRFLGRILTYHNSVYLRDIGNPKALSEANRDIFLGKVKF